MRVSPSFLLVTIYVGIGVVAGVVLLALPFVGNWPGWRQLIPYGTCLLAGICIGLAVALPLFVMLNRLWETGR